MTSRGRLDRRLVAALALALTLGSWCTHASAQSVGEPAPSDSAASSASFQYLLRRTLEGGTGSYAGYEDSLLAGGRYDITREPTELRIFADYRWRYLGDTCDSGRVSRTVRATLPDRLYAGQTDLDDYDALGGTPLATWVWIPPSSAVGDHVAILERDFVIDAREDLQLGSVAVPALRARAEGTGTRDDAYGRFTTRFVDTYWFHARTGYFLESDYRESDSNDEASFEWRERLRLVEASYLPPGAGVPDRSIPACPAAEPPGTHERAGRALTILVPLALLLVGLLYFVLRSRAPTRDLRVLGQIVSTSRVTSPAELPARSDWDSPQLDPFIRHLARRALRMGDKVTIATLADGRHVGIAIDDAEARVGSIYAREGDVCERLRLDLGVERFFTDHPHETLPSVAQAAREVGHTTAPRAYNLQETYEILALEGLVAKGHDGAVVSRLRDEDLDDAQRLYEKVNGLRGDAFLKAALQEGDLAFGARADDALVGLALVTMVDEQARLHSIMVDPDARGRGLGSELVRAALDACAAAGARRAIAEIPAGSVAALALLGNLGFARVGVLRVESAASTRTDGKTVRR